jgi:hypothetical protein
MDVKIMGQENVYWVQKVQDIVDFCTQGNEYSGFISWLPDWFCFMG